MPATYSINVGTEYESTRLPDLISVLKNIPNNTEKLISPKDVRDAFLSTWANSTFKQTKNQSGIEYIGIDSGNPTNRDVKQKILLGKRSSSSGDVMNLTLLNDPYSDIYFYNTKSDSSLQSNSTKISILAGTQSSLFTQAPFIESKSDGTNYEFNFRNPGNGSINIRSETGRVSINGIIFPTVAESNSSSIEGKVLRYDGTFPNGSLKWDDTNVSLSEIGKPGSPTNIYGSVVNVNGYPLDFTNNTMVPVSVGGIKSGMSFSSNSFYNGTSYQNWPLTQVLKELLYPYVPPKISIDLINLSTNNTYAEFGNTYSLKMNYSITVYPRTSTEYVRDFAIIGGTTKLLSSGNPSAQPASGLSFSSTYPGRTFIGGITISNVYNATLGTTFSNYSMKLSDTSNAAYPTGFSHSATASINWVFPIYYGFTSSLISNVNNYKFLNKMIMGYPGVTNSISVNYSGSGYLYFAYTNATTFKTTVSLIKDPNGFVLYSIVTGTQSSFFNYSAVTSINTINSLTTNYLVWRTTGTCSYSQNGQFEFKF